MADLDQVDPDSRRHAWADGFGCQDMRPANDELGHLEHSEPLPPARDGDQHGRGVEDLIELDHWDTETILENFRAGFFSGKPYTGAGSLLVVLNPCRDLGDVYGRDMQVLAALCAYLSRYGWGVDRLSTPGAIWSRDPKSSTEVSQSRKHEIFTVSACPSFHVGACHTRLPATFFEDIFSPLLRNCEYVQYTVGKYEPWFSGHACCRNTSLSPFFTVPNPHPLACALDSSSTCATTERIYPPTPTR